MYKIQNTETGLFLTNNKYVSWTKRGKTYATLGNIKIKLTAALNNLVAAEIDRLCEAAIGPYEWSQSYREAHNKFYNREDIRDLSTLRRKERRKELYQRFLPKNWKIVKVAEIIEPEDIDIERLFQ